MAEVHGNSGGAAQVRWWNFFDITSTSYEIKKSGLSGTKEEAIFEITESNWSESRFCFFLLLFTAC